MGRNVRVVCGVVLGHLVGSGRKYKKPTLRWQGMDELLKQEVKDFLTTRRARITPAAAGLETQPWSDRRVPGLRREEVADLAGISLEYYIRFERGNLKGASPEILQSLAKALQLSPIEREHLHNLAYRADHPRNLPSAETPTAPLQDIVDAVTDKPAWIRNEQMDILATNRLCAELYAPIFKDLPDRPNTAALLYRRNSLRVLGGPGSVQCGVRCQTTPRVRPAPQRARFKGAYRRAPSEKFCFPR